MKRAMKASAFVADNVSLAGSIPLAIQLKVSVCDTQIVIR